MGAPVIEVSVEEVGPHVRGTVVIAEPLEVRSIVAFVTYAERSAEFTHELAAVRTVSRAQGRLEAGTRLPFVLELPQPIAPSAVTPWGSLSWQLRVKADVPNRRDVQQVVPLDL